MGLDLVLGKIRDNVKAGVLEPLVSKVKCIRYFLILILFRFATEAAITILRIDDMIKLEKK
jgi:T-complex protein 1 subunit alpha